MSKSQLKKYLKELNKDQLEEFILDIYSDFKPAKEYIDFFLNPDVTKLVNKTQSQLYSKFYRPNGEPVTNLKFSKVNAIMKDFTNKICDPYIVADMMVYLLTLICDYGRNYSYSESFVRSVISNFKRLSNWLVTNGLEKEYHQKMENLIAMTYSIGWNCSDGVYSEIDPCFINA
ncbi:MAG: hypothetical protein HDR88_09605 [Bacteroides sp.]|nr:hypothetical protein [Bacteroides sp.]